MCWRWARTPCDCDGVRQADSAVQNVAAHGEVKEEYEIYYMHWADDDNAISHALRESFKIPIKVISALDHTLISETDVSKALSVMIWLSAKYGVRPVQCLQQNHLCNLHGQQSFHSTNFCGVCSQLSIRSQCLLCCN